MLVVRQPHRHIVGSVCDSSELKIMRKLEDQTEPCPDITVDFELEAATAPTNDPDDFTQSITGKIFSWVMTTCRSPSRSAACQLGWYRLAEV